MSQLSSQSFDLLGGGSYRRRRRSRSRSRSTERSLVRRPKYLFPRNWKVPRAIKGTVHQFTRITATNFRVNAAAVDTNYWAVNNRTLNAISYGGTTPNVPGNQISFYFDFLSAHMDLYTDQGAVAAQIAYEIPNVAEFAALYEEFRIDWVQIDCYASMMNSYRASSQPDLITSNSPILYYVKDYNDADSTNLTQMMQQEDVGMWQPSIGNDGTYHRRIRVKPRANFVVASTSMVGAGTAKVPGLSWLTTEDSQTIPHYGVKMAANTFFPSGDATNTISFYLGFQFTYHFSFRNVK